MAEQKIVTGYEELQEELESGLNQTRQTDKDIYFTFRIDDEHDPKHFFGVSQGQVYYCHSNFYPTNSPISDALQRVLKNPETEFHNVGYNTAYRVHETEEGVRLRVAESPLKLLEASISTAKKSVQKPENASPPQEPSLKKGLWASFSLFKGKEKVSDGKSAENKPVDKPNVTIGSHRKT